MARQEDNVLHHRECVQCRRVRDVAPAACLEDLPPLPAHLDEASLEVVRDGSCEAPLALFFGEVGVGFAVEVGLGADGSPGATLVVAPRGGGREVALEALEVAVAAEGGRVLAHEHVGRRPLGVDPGVSKRPFDVCPDALGDDGRDFGLVTNLFVVGDGLGEVKERLERLGCCVRCQFSGAGCQKWLICSPAISFPYAWIATRFLLNLGVKTSSRCGWVTPHILKPIRHHEGSIGWRPRI